jgi:hypothetical protein
VEHPMSEEQTRAEVSTRRRITIAGQDERRARGSEPA